MNQQYHAIVLRTLGRWHTVQLLRSHHGKQKTSMQKLYAYVDESGQETGGAIFVVSVAIMETDRDSLLTRCGSIESDSKKGAIKWHRARREDRLEYIRQIVEDKQFKGVLFYSLFRETKDYDACIAMGIARAINRKKASANYKASIYIDALPKSKITQYGGEMRKSGVKSLKVRGVTSDENNALIRLADAVAGLVRDALGERDAEAKALYTLAKKKKAQYGFQGGEDVKIKGRVVKRASET